MGREKVVIYPTKSDGKKQYIPRRLKFNFQSISTGIKSETVWLRKLRNT